MKSVTIKDLTGKKLIKVFKKKGVYYCETLSRLADIDVLIITDDNRRVNIRVD
jgi:hypothetical protein